MKILIVANEQKREALSFVGVVKSFCETCKCECRVSVSWKEALTDNGVYGEDLVIVLGGDGTVISTVHRLGYRKQPMMLNVNVGHLGYMTGTNQEGFYEAFHSILSGKAKFQRRWMLKCIESVCGKKTREFFALNEFVCAPKRVGNIVKVAVGVNGKHLSTIAGDGVIISTPTGSTAYALSAGGPIMSPNVHGMVLVPICPHQLSNRPIVLSKDDEITVSLDGESRQAFQLCYDGYEEILDPGVLTISLSGKSVMMYRGDEDEYGLVRSKLGWQ
jgi:NAD+ kinase